MRSLRVLHMTGYSGNAIVHHGKLDPDVELIQKPLTSQQLAATICTVLGPEAIRFTRSGYPDGTMPFTALAGG